MRDKLIELIKSNEDPCDNGECPFDDLLERPCSLCATETIADHLIANGVTFAECLVDTNKTFADVPDTNVGKWISTDKATEHKPKPVPYSSKEFTVFIREGASLNGIPCTAVGMRYKYKGEIYGIEIPFSQLRLADNDVAEACKELALCFLDSLKALEQQERRP